MRQVRENQPSFPLHQCEHRHGQELEQISRILDENPTLAEVVVQHLESDSGRGAPGMIRVFWWTTFGLCSTPKRTTINAWRSSYTKWWKTSRNRRRIKTSF